MHVAVEILDTAAVNFREPRDRRETKRKTFRTLRKASNMKDSRQLREADVKTPKNVLFTG
jgi:hypothetical protein